MKSYVDLEPNFYTYDSDDNFGQFRWKYLVENSGLAGVYGKIRVNFPGFTIGGRKMLNAESAKVEKFMKNGEREYYNCSIPSTLDDELYRLDDLYYKRIKNFRHYGCSTENCRGTCAARCIQIECDTQNDVFSKNERLVLTLDTQLDHRKWILHIYVLHSM